MEAFLKWILSLFGNDKAAAPEPSTSDLRTAPYTVKLAWTGASPWSKTVEFPALGKFVTESHYATTEDSFGARLFPTTGTEGINVHLDRSLALLKKHFPDATKDSVYPPAHTWTRVWTPPEGGKAGQAAVGDVKPTPEQELWQGNMMFAKGQLPPRGTKFLMTNLSNGRQCVIQMGFEIGPRSSAYLGGVTREVHWYLKSTDAVALKLEKLADQSTPLGPVLSEPIVKNPIPDGEGDEVVAKLGDENEVVSTIQMKLKDRGIDPGTIDGKYGPNTAAAVSVAKGRVGIWGNGNSVTHNEMEKIVKLAVVEKDRPSVSTPGQKLLRHPTAIKSYSHKTAGAFRKGYPEGLVVHFTAGQCDDEGDMVGSIEWGKGEGYAFWAIGPTGKLYDTHSLDRWGHHAGSSFWKPFGSSVSQYLLGVEIASAGRLESGRKSWFGKTYPESKTRTVKAEANMVAGTYLKYTEEQEETLIGLCVWLKSNNPDVFSFDNVVGHDEIAPGRKNDPGGALSMTMPEFRAKLKELYAAK